MNAVFRKFYCVLPKCARKKSAEYTIHTLCLCCSARSVTSAILEARDNSSIRTYKYKYKHKFGKCEHNER